MLLNKKYVWLFVSILIAIEQIIKIIINNNYLNKNIPILEPWVYFRPMFNRDYSWFNSMFQLGIGKWFHIILTTIITVLICLFYIFLSSKINTKGLADIAFAFILAGAICSFIDKVFWNGSLDYIMLKGLFTFDLKDVYINIFIILMFFMMGINYQGVRSVDDKDVIKEFMNFLKGR